MRRLWIVGVLGGVLIAGGAGAQSRVRLPNPAQLEHWRRENQAQRQSLQEQQSLQQQQAQQQQELRQVQQGQWWQQWQQQQGQQMRDVDESYRRLMEQRQLQDLRQRVQELEQRRAY